MKYMGSKNRVAKYILPIMLSERSSLNQYWVEPFVGGANTIDKVQGKRIGADLNPYTIEALISIRDYLTDLPKNNQEFTEDDYKELRKNDEYRHKGYAGFVFSYGGKWLGGWCRDGKGKRDYVRESYDNAKKQSPKLQGIELVKSDFQNLEIPPNSLIYCDPPYKGTTKYKDDFNHDAFWQWCQEKETEGHTVFVSEYDAPDGFECIWQKEIVSSLTKDTGSKKAVEKLFRCKTRKTRKTRKGHAMIDREEFLDKLTSVAPGLADREILEQTTCFVFTGEEIITFNEVISCRIPYKTSFRGAVQGAPLLGILHKLTETTLKVGVKGSELRIAGKGRSLGLTLEQEITLGIEDVEPPDTWKHIPQEMGEAIGFVQNCCSDNESMYNLTCVHFTPDCLEATDNEQLGLYKVKLPIEKPFLVPQEAALSLVDSNLTQMGVASNWVHFQNEQGLTISCRKSDTKQYPPIKETVENTNGRPIPLDKSLIEVVDRAEVFSADNPDDNFIRVQLAKNKMRIRGEGSLGWYREDKTVAYKGPSISFQIKPKMFARLIEHGECFIGDSRIKFTGSNFAFLCCLVVS